MRNISDLPNEVILMIFVKATYFGDLFALSRTCKRFRRLFKRYDRSVSKEIAIHNYSVPHRLLGFGGRNPSIRSLLVLNHWTTEIGKFGSLCDKVRHSPPGDENAPWRAVWFTPLWQELLQFGLYLFKMLSLSTSIVERLEQLPSPFHAILRFTSIIVFDMVRLRFARAEGGTAFSWIRRALQSGRAPGDTAPWIYKDLQWRCLEIHLFEQGCEPFLELMTIPQDDLIRRSRREPQGDTMYKVLKSGRLAQDRHYYLRLDSLCLQYGRVWGGPEFWRNFDPFGLKDSGLSGREAMEEMVKQLPR